MANFIPKQFILGNINNGNEYVIEDGLQPKTINDVVEGVAYCDEQRQALVQTPNIVENEGELGIQWINTTVNGRTYKKLQFSNIKGDKGNRGKGFRPQGAWVQGKTYINDSEHIDTVAFSGSTYYALETHTSTVNDSPPSDKWGILAVGGTEAVDNNILLPIYTTDIDGDLETITTTLAELKTMGDRGTFVAKEALTKELVNYEFDLDKVYPIGSIYMSVDNSFLPASYFGGGWEKIKDRFLLASGDTYTGGNSGGAATHNHTSGTLGAELTSTNDDIAINEVNYNVDYNANVRVTTSGIASQVSEHSAVVKIQGSTANTSSLPPYLVVNIWKRYL